MKCMHCDKKATHITPLNLCDFHYVESYSFQTIGDKQVPFKKVLKEQLEKTGMWKREDESLDEWYLRCKDDFNKRTKKS
ncbi:MAG TPA: hypothetical protein DHN29_18225 [Cytophagales bacterium]|nr:hypothetical protein [Cytophagales bacterium]|tara:strand:- start:240 stop:476 length:237 start_codon:yes stop_codon:yes gene_type:complete